MSLSSIKFVVTSADFDAPASSKSWRRVLLNPDVLKNAKIFAGDVVAVQPSEPAETPAFAIGAAWPAPDVPPSCEKVWVIPAPDTAGKKGLPDLKHIPSASSVIVTEESATRSEWHNFKERLEKGPDWLMLGAREHLVDLRYIHVGLRFILQYEGCERAFLVTNVRNGGSGFEDSQLADGMASMNLQDPKSPVLMASWATKVSVEAPKGLTTEHESSRLNDRLGMHTLCAQDGYATVGGLDKQVSQIKDLIEMPLHRPDLFKHFGLRPPKGVLLHGPPGTGKTHLARAVVSATRSSGTSVLTIAGSELSSAYHGETERKLRETFEEARRKSPCIVILDEVDALAPNRGADGDSAGGEVEKRVVATLLSILDGVNEDGAGSEERVIVIGTTNRPNALDAALRRPGRFDREIEIGIPDPDARLSILRVILSKTPHSLLEADIRSIASRTHGYVGADLSAFVREAALSAIKRSIGTLDTFDISRAGDLRGLLITLFDIEEALRVVQPSALRSISLEVPAVRWSDIGGQALVAQKLRECVEWPLKHPEAFARLGVRPPRGVLLYGPPGCSKTLTARALATESGINFLAVKGPELLNKYVGESERAVRDTFRKARAAAPSIVFFDEIDALGTSRALDVSSGERHAGVLTTLLNEMDGVQDLSGVTVVAATNRPEVIDSALMRPGRLDRILYVGPPDRGGRIEILRIQTSKMTVDPQLDLEELTDLTDGCSGAELSALCQDAALHAMQENIEAPFVPRSSFLSAAKDVRRQITPEVIAKFEQWRSASGITSA